MQSSDILCSFLCETVLFVIVRSRSILPLLFYFLFQRHFPKCVSLSFNNFPKGVTFRMIYLSLIFPWKININFSINMLTFIFDNLANISDNFISIAFYRIIISMQTFITLYFIIPIIIYIQFYIIFCYLCTLAIFSSL